MSGANGRIRRSSDPSADRGRGRKAGHRAGGKGARGSKTVQFVIPSDFAAGCEVQQQIIDAIEKNGYDEDCVFGIKLAVDEALINAIKHGNRLDPGKHVRVEASITPKRLEIVIEDEGPGFNRGRVPDPTAAENLEKPSGRGILLMEAYMDRVVWSRGGRRVRMIKSGTGKK